ncbi:hypothetical protein BJ508DRAFT_336849 [Ascobolus immersus RN42]|uniref:Uncharacterized protein n=1 Tax=Ascobolus immersus RN42 TaxID=1160509 RepID=A0A3N4H758_ASCIM|nr:hypothetical protein BJ508DRAFT_336849 [Ascobolus immersus RN42]
MPPRVKACVKDRVPSTPECDRDTRLRCSDTAVVAAAGKVAVKLNQLSLIADELVSAIDQFSSAMPGCVPSSTHEDTEDDTHTLKSDGHPLSPPPAQKDRIMECRGSNLRALHNPADPILGDPEATIPREEVLTRGCREWSETRSNTSVCVRRDLGGVERVYVLCKAKNGEMFGSWLFGEEEDLIRRKVKKGNRRVPPPAGTPLSSANQNSGNNDEFEHDGFQKGSDQRRGGGAVPPRRHRDTMQPDSKKRRNIDREESVELGNDHDQDHTGVLFDSYSEIDETMDADRGYDQSTSKAAPKIKKSSTATPAMAPLLFPQKSTSTTKSTTAKRPAAPSLPVNWTPCFWEHEEHTGSAVVTFSSDDPQMLHNGALKYTPEVSVDDESGNPVGINASVVMEEGSCLRRFGAKLTVAGVPVGWMTDDKDVVRGLYTARHNFHVSLIWDHVVNTRANVVAVGRAKWKASQCPGRQPPVAS